MINFMQNDWLEKVEIYHKNGTFSVPGSGDVVAKRVGLMMRYPPLECAGYNTLSTHFSP